MVDVGGYTGCFVGIPIMEYSKTLSQNAVKRWFLLKMPKNTCQDVLKCWILRLWGPHWLLDLLKGIAMPQFYWGGRQCTRKTVRRWSRASGINAFTCFQLIGFHGFSERKGFHGSYTIKCTELRIQCKATTRTQQTESRQLRCMLYLPIPKKLPSSVGVFSPFPIFLASGNPIEPNNPSPTQPASTEHHVGHQGFSNIHFATADALELGCLTWLDSKMTQRTPLLGGSSQVVSVVRITSIYKP